MQFSDLLLNSALKVTALFALAFAAARLLKRQSASVRHGVWLAVFGGAVLLPFASRFAVWQGWSGLAMAGALPRIADTFVVVRADGAAGFDPALWIGAIWLLGASGVLFYWLAGVWKVAAIAKRATPLAGEHAVLRSAEIAVPCTCGAIKPVVLLPAESVEWDAERLRIVLAHERAHIARRDGLSHLLTQLAIAAYWFHPLTWLAARRLRIEREKACDDLVLESGASPSRYAQSLLEIATGRAVPYPALSIAERSTLGDRVQSILDPAQRRSRLPVWAPAVLCLALAAVVLPLSAMQGAKEEAQQEKAKTSRIQVKGAVMSAKVIHKVQPKYPVSAKTRGIQGAVELEAVIGRDGAVENLSVLSSPDSDLSDAAREAVRQWRYETTLLNGEPVEVETTIIVNFTLAP